MSRGSTVQQHLTLANRIFFEVEEKLLSSGYFGANIKHTVGNKKILKQLCKGYTSFLSSSGSLLSIIVTL